MNLTLPQGSSDAAHVDVIFLSLLGMSGLVLLLVFGAVILFAVRYRRGSSARRGPLPSVISRDVEIGWTVATLFLALFIFWWAASSQLSRASAPGNAVEIHVVGQQWYWTAQHAGGLRELNELHVPTGTPVKLLLTSQDVIHSFYVPAFRMKQDAVPGMVTTTWFDPTRPGAYHLFCAEYCGVDHSRMVGTVYVMRPADFARWLRRQPAGDDLASQGAAVFRTRGCSGCHAAGAAVRAPDLAGLAGRRVRLAGGGTVLADDAYIRDSILRPRAAVVAGYEPFMPSYDGLITEGEMIPLIAYLKNLETGETVR